MTKSVVISVHMDDEVLSAVTFMSRSSEVHIIYCAYSGDDRKEERCRALSMLDKFRSDKDLSPCKFIDLDLPDTKLPGLIPELSSSISEYIDSLDLGIDDYILIPFESLHQDHVAVNQASLIASRRSKSTILECEYVDMLYTNRKVDPNYYVPMSSDELNLKLSMMENGYASQNTSGRSVKSIRTLAELRGLESYNNYAEGFRVVRINSNIE